MPVIERDGWRWINRCPVCGEPTELCDDDFWYCEAGHRADMPNQKIVRRPDAR